MKKKIIFVFLFLFLFVIFILLDVSNFFDFDLNIFENQDKKEYEEKYSNVYRNNEFGFEFIYHLNERLNEESLKHNKVEFDFGGRSTNVALNTIEYWKSDYSNYEEMKKNIREEYVKKMSGTSYTPLFEKELIIGGKSAYQISGIDNELKENNDVAPERVYTFVLNNGNLFKFSTGYGCRACFFSEEIMINKFFRFID